MLTLELINGLTNFCYFC